MRSSVFVLLLAAIAALYWFRWRPVQGEIAALRAREDIEQRAIEAASLGLQGRRELAGAMLTLRHRLDAVVPPASSDPDTDALVDVTKLARSCRLEVVSIGGATVATPPPVSGDGGPPAASRYARVVTVHGSLANELALVDGLSGLRPLIQVDGVTFRTALRGGVDAGIAYEVVALRSIPGVTR